MQSEASESQPGVNKKARHWRIMWDSWGDHVGQNVG